MEGTARVAFSAARPRPPTPVGVEGASPRFTRGRRSVVGRGSVAVQRGPATAQRDGGCFPFPQARCGCSPIASGDPRWPLPPVPPNRSMHSGAVASRCRRPPRRAATVSEPPAQGSGRGLVQSGPLGAGLPREQIPPSGTSSHPGCAEGTKTVAAWRQPPRPRSPVCQAAGRRQSPLRAPWT